VLSCDVVDPLFIGRQQVEKESRESTCPKRGSDGLVSRAQPTAAAAVREDNEPVRVIRYGEVSRQLSSVDKPKMNYPFSDGRAREAIHMILRRSDERTRYVIDDR
jgi:hypothetical protein